MNSREYDIAWAAGMDKAKGRMQAAGRSKMSRGDYNAMVAEFKRLMPDPDPSTIVPSVLVGHTADGLPLYR